MNTWISSEFNVTSIECLVLRDLSLQAVFMSSVKEVSICILSYSSAYKINKELGY